MEQPISLLYLRSELSSNSIRPLLLSELSDLEINKLTRETKHVVKSRLFTPAVLMISVIGILNRDKEFTLSNNPFEYTNNMLKS